MVHFLAAASRAAVVSVRCTWCGRTQVRERRAEPARYRCKHCHRTFTPAAASADDDASTRRRGGSATR